MKMTYIMSCVWLDYMIKYFQCKNCVGSSLKTKKCVASFLVPGDIKKRRESPSFLMSGHKKQKGLEPGRVGRLWWDTLSQALQQLAV